MKKLIGKSSKTNAIIAILELKARSLKWFIGLSAWNHFALLIRYVRNNKLKGFIPTYVDTTVAGSILLPVLFFSFSKAGVFREQFKQSKRYYIKTIA